MIEKSKMSVRELRLGGCAIVVASALFAARAQADDDTRSAAAQVAFDEGLALLDAGRVAEACVKLSQSYTLEPGGGALLDLAICREREGRLATAWTLFHDAASMAVRDGRADRESTARTHVATLQPNLGRLVVAIIEPADEVLLDGHVLPRESWNAPIPVDSGHHTLTARRLGAVDWSGSVDTSDGATARVSVGPFAHDAAPAIITSAPTWPRTLSFIGLAIGGASVLVAAGFGVDAIVQKAVVDDGCKENVCNDVAFDAQSRGRASAALSTGFFITGGIVLAAAIVGIIVAPRRAPAVAANGLRWTF